MARKYQKFEHYQLSLDELKLLDASKSNPNLFFEYWFHKDGVDRPFQLDYNFTEEGKWQVDYCLAQQTRIVVVAGIGTGKTLAVGMSACFHAVLNDDFRFLNIGYELRQAQYMYDLIIEFSRGTRFEKLIVKKPRSPNPKIVIEFKIGTLTRRAELLFMSAGENNDALNVLSWRGDMINVEELGRFPNINELLTNLTTRLTGSTASGRPYMARLSGISNPFENPELWALVDECLADPEHSLVFNIDTEKNRNVTRAQVEAQMRNMTKEDQERWMTGKRPEGQGKFFSKDLTRRAESIALSDRIKMGIASGEPGWVAEGSNYFGWTHFQMPADRNRIYLMVGDPGIGNPPLRNAPAILALDVTDYEKSGFAFICGMWWGYGRGSIQPFVSQYLHWIDFYKPLEAGIDSTATQKNMAELMNLDYIWNKNKSIDYIMPLDFSGGRKIGYLQSARLTLEQNRIQYPHEAKGISQQLLKYDLLEDGPGNTTTKLAQDLVATFGMAAWRLRALYGLLDGKEDEDKAKVDGLANPNSSRAFPRERRSTARRTTPPPARVLR